MTTPIPPDARKVVLAAVVSCDTTTFGKPLCEADCWLSPNEACVDCNGDGTRTVVTDIEVEPDDAVSGDTTVRVWLEVEP